MTETARINAACLAWLNPLAAALGARLEWDGTIRPGWLAVIPQWPELARALTDLVRRYPPPPELPPVLVVTRYVGGAPPCPPELLQQRAADAGSPPLTAREWAAVVPRPPLDPPRPPVATPRPTWTAADEENLRRDVKAMIRKAFVGSPYEWPGNQAARRVEEAIARWDADCAADVLPRHRYAGRPRTRRIAKSCAVCGRRIWRRPSQFRGAVAVCRAPCRPLWAARPQWRKSAESPA